MLWYFKRSSILSTKAATFPLSYYTVRATTYVKWLISPIYGHSLPPNPASFVVFVFVSVVPMLFTLSLDETIENKATTNDNSNGYGNGIIKIIQRQRLRFSLLAPPPAHAAPLPAHRRGNSQWVNSNNLSYDTRNDTADHTCVRSSRHRPSRSRESIDGHDFCRCHRCWRERN